MGKKAKKPRSDSSNSQDKAAQNKLESESTPKKTNIYGNSAGHVQQYPLGIQLQDEHRVTLRCLITGSLFAIFAWSFLSLVMILYLTSMTPHTPEELERCRKNEYDPTSDVVQLTELNFVSLTSPKESSWLVELLRKLYFFYYYNIILIFVPKFSDILQNARTAKE